MLDEVRNEIRDMRCGIWVKIGRILDVGLWMLDGDQVKSQKEKVKKLAGNARCGMRGIKAKLKRKNAKGRLSNQKQKVKNQKGSPGESSNRFGSAPRAESKIKSQK